MTIYRLNLTALFVTAFSFLFSVSIRGNDGVALLKVDHGARSAGMGSTQIPHSGDPNGVVHNPALGLGFEKFTASFGHTEFWENIRLESGFFCADLDSNWSIHGGIRYATVNDLEARTTPTSTATLFDSHDLSFKGGIAYRLDEKINLGIAAGWIIEKIGAYRGSAFNFDVGTVVHLNPNADINAAATNIGPSFKLELTGMPGSDDVSLPTTYRLGGTYRYQRYLASAEFVYLDETAHAHLGAEAKMNEIFSLRSGYMINYDTKNFTAGASFSRRNITVDYAFVPFTQSLGTSHLFNLTFSL